jgi:hypothetical protein
MFSIHIFQQIQTKDFNKSVLHGQRVYTCQNYYFLALLPQFYRRQNVLTPVAIQWCMPDWLNVGCDLHAVGYGQLGDGRLGTLTSKCTPRKNGCRCLDGTYGRRETFSSGIPSAGKCA